MTASAKALELAQIAAQAASEKLAENIVAIDVSDRHALNDVFLIASSRNERQTPAIADEITFKMHEAGVRLLRQEGKAAGTWIVLDFGDVQCHVMQEESRMFYEIERLWKDCPIIQLELENAN